MHYVDTSAFVKLLLPEAHGAPIRQYLKGQPLVASALLEVELVRAVNRTDPTQTAAAANALRQVQLVPIDAQVLTAAADLAPAALRALDALHLATALSIREHLTSFVTYDRQLGAAAIASGLTLAAPGIT